MTRTQHKRTAVASMFQNGISQNTKCAERDGFRIEGHIYIIKLYLIGYIAKLKSYIATITDTYNTC